MNSNNTNLNSNKSTLIEKNNRLDYYLNRDNFLDYWNKKDPLTINHGFLGLTLVLKTRCNLNC